MVKPWSSFSHARASPKKAVSRVGGDVEHVSQKAKRVGSGNKKIKKKESQLGGLYRGSLKEDEKKTEQKSEQQESKAATGSLSLCVYKKRAHLSLEL